MSLDVRGCNFGGVCVVCGRPGVPFHGCVHEGCTVRDRWYECNGCRRRVRVALADLDGERHLIACIVGRDDVQAAIVCGGWRDMTEEVS